MLNISGMFLLFATVFALFGCGQNVDKVQVVPRNPLVPETYITSMETQGGSDTIATSVNRSLGIQSFGGNSVRTLSTSASFRLTGGIGVD